MLTAGPHWKNTFWCLANFTGRNASLGLGSTRVPNATCLDRYRCTRAFCQHWLGTSQLQPDGRRAALGAALPGFCALPPPPPRTQQLGSSTAGTAPSCFWTSAEVTSPVQGYSCWTTSGGGDIILSKLARVLWEASEAGFLVHGDSVEPSHLALRVNTEDCDLHIEQQTMTEQKVHHCESEKKVVFRA